jgi:hypothetical protein
MIIKIKPIGHHKKMYARKKINNTKVNDDKKL